MTTRRKVVLGVVALALVAFGIWAANRISGLSEETQATNPLFRWEYLFARERTPEELWENTREHLELTIISVALGIVLSALLSALILRFSWLRAAVFTFAGVLYTIPSIALFAILVTYNPNGRAAVIALTSYTLLILTRNFVAGIDGVPRAALDAADGLGMSRTQRLRRVELPAGPSGDPHRGARRHRHRRGTGRDLCGDPTGRPRHLHLRRLQPELLDAAGARHRGHDPAGRGAGPGHPGHRAPVHPVDPQAGGTMTTVALLAQAAEPTNVWEWLNDSSQRTFTGDIPSQAWATLWHSVLAFAIAAALAIPVAAALAHYRKAEVSSTWLVNIGRVIPTVTIVAVLVIISLRNGYGFEPWPIVIALVLLALPPLYANTYTAVRDASPEAVGAARAMGLTELQILRRVELPLATPLILAASRVAITQVVATEALAALFGGTGLGQYITFGLANRDTFEVQAGAVLVAGLAMAVDVVFWFATRVLVPAPLRPAPSSRRAMRASRPITPSPIQTTSLGGNP
ncbi:ABC transporter permease [Aquihabitans daechungensis]|uniref:ABC transporter permease n=1 Tax=Aquihabitans daechungensis TaxID=1052257 RepID=UPI003B9F8A1C